MNSILVVGAGAMGSGIAQLAAQSGYPVFLWGRGEDFFKKGIGAISKNLERQVEKGKLDAAERNSILGRITGVTDFSKASSAFFVVEAVIENMDAKKALFAELDEKINPDAILASNTSSLSVTEMAAATKRPEKVVGMHFFNPAPVMALIEVIRGAVTSDETYDKTMKLSTALGKTPVTVHEAPGFVVNRILIPMINEAAFVFSEGVANAEDIDTAMKLGANHPMGPLALGDLIGLDVCLAIMETLYAETGDSKYRPAPVLRKMVRAKLLGRKTGRGFFNY